MSTARELAARATRQAARVQDRIAASTHTVVLEAPATPTVPQSTTVGPTTPPTSPLTGAPRPTTLLPPDPTPEPVRPALTLACLWYEATTVSDFRRDAVEAGPTGWLEGADAMAQVSAEDRVPADFRGLDGVQHRIGATADRRYTLLKATPLGPAFGAPHSFALWLRMAAV